LRSHAQAPLTPSLPRLLRLCMGGRPIIFPSIRCCVHVSWRQRHTRRVNSDSTAALSSSRETPRTRQTASPQYQVKVSVDCTKTHSRAARSIAFKGAACAGAATAARAQWRTHPTTGTPLRGTRMSVAGWQLCGAASTFVNVDSHAPSSRRQDRGGADAARWHAEHRGSGLFPVLFSRTRGRCTGTVAALHARVAVRRRQHKITGQRVNGPSLASYMAPAL
jgi:hypothetical protein